VAVLVNPSSGDLIMLEGEQSPPLPRRFPTTHWSRIAEARDIGSPGTRDALAALCHAYWYPLYLFIRKQGYRAEEAGDLVQEYFVRLLEGQVLDAADRTKGRFRTFLIADCKHFLSHERVKARAMKRGGDRSIFSIDSGDADGRYTSEPSNDKTPEQSFVRAWAITLLESVLARLSSEYDKGGRSKVFERLKDVITVGLDSVPYATIAAELEMSEGAVQVAVHRLRRRYGALLREEISDTVSNPGEVEDEIRQLFSALGS
jgi:RNA polymerase sigma factor (sigma-70 family)